MKGRFNFTASRRILIPKPKGKKRPLRIAMPREKIIQKALAVILQAIWEEEFLDTSHGFRLGRSIHTALKELYIEGGRFTWVIQGDITKCFDSIPHDVIMKLLRRKIRCQRTLEHIRKSLTAGYRDPENNKIIEGTRGTAQGSVLSPILCNIVLHELDQYIRKVKKRYERGKTRRRNQEYVEIISKRRSIRDPKRRKEILAKARKLHSKDQIDPNFRRLKYVRYADDFVILILGSHAEAERVKRNVGIALTRKCGLELNTEKTTITQIEKQGFKFLGAACNKADRAKAYVTKHGRMKSARANVRLRVNADIDRVTDRLLASKMAKRGNDNKITGSVYNAMVNMEHSDIISFYNSKMRGILNYYSFAGNRSRLWEIV